MHEYDKSSKWLIQHHGDSILRLAGVTDLAEWRPLQAELVQPRRLPDGLIEARRKGQTEPELFILELATYPESRIGEQLARDLALVYLDRGAMPEAVVLVLHPRGNQRAPERIELASPLGWTQWQLRWRLVELWKVPSKDLLNADDVGLIPWVPLTHFDDSPESILRECRTRIDRDAPPAEHENLLAVTQVLASLRYNDSRLFQLLRGRDAMIESPLLQELKLEWTRDAVRDARRRDILDVLLARFGADAENLRAEIGRVEDEALLKVLLKRAASASNLGDFRERLSEVPGPT